MAGHHPILIDGVWVDCYIDCDLTILRLSFGQMSSDVMIDLLLQGCVFECYVLPVCTSHCYVMVIFQESVSDLFTGIDVESCYGLAASLRVIES